MENLKSFVWKQRDVVSLLLLVLLAAVHLPWHVDRQLVFALLPLLLLFREEFPLPKQFKLLALLFFSYLLLFTAISVDVQQSIAADTRVLKGMMFLLYGWLFCIFIKNAKSLLAHALVMFCLIAANFFFRKNHIVLGEHYYSYHTHPNMAAFSLLFLMALSLVLLVFSRTTLEKLLNAAGIVAGVVLLVVTNSRSVWLGLIAAAVAITLISNRASMKIKGLVLSFCAVSAGLLFVVFDKKNHLESMSIRETVWKSIYSATVENHPLLGYGLNTYGKMFNELRPLANKPHNSILEIFLSSGIAGLAIMLFIVTCLCISAYGILKKAGDKDEIRLAELSCYFIIALLVISLFDFMVFDYKFMATVMVFAGFLNFVGSSQVRDVTARCDAGVETGM